MKIRIVKIGKPQQSEYRSLTELFTKRLRSFAPTEVIEIKAQQGQAKHQNELTEALGLHDSSNTLVCLHERGKLLSSEDLADRVREWQSDGRVKRVTFLVGGPCGLSAEILNQAALHWSLSPAIVPSDLAWLMATEQLYRSYTILNHTGYHHT